MTTTARVALYLMGGLFGLGVAVALFLRSITPGTYMEINDNLTDATVVLLWIAAVGQTLFIALWLSLPWYSHWVGRALMVKSLALATYLDFAVVVHYVDPWPALPTLGVILFGFITVGVWSQLSVLAFQSFRPGGRAEVKDESRRIGNGRGAYIRDRED